MQFTPALLSQHTGRFTRLKTPLDTPAAQRDPRVVETVSRMLLDIERRGLDAVRKYARDLDGWTREDFSLEPDRVAQSGDRLDPELRSAIELGAERTQAFARRQREGLVDFDVELEPGLHTGVRYVPVGRVGAYLPAGRFPLTASAFMTVGVAKAAGVPHVTACTPPQPDGGANDAVLYTAHVSGVDRVYVLGGVQALAAMALGLIDDLPVDMLVGAGNAYVAEAKRQLFGRVAIDLPAGPSEVAVLSDASADPAIVAADLLGQAEHGTNSPAALVTTDADHGAAVIAEVERQLATLATAEICGPAWRDHGSVTVADSPEVAVALMDDLARSTSKCSPRTMLGTTTPAELRVGVPRRVEHRRILRQGHGRNQSHASHGGRRQAQRGSFGVALPEAPHLPARGARGDAPGGARHRHHLSLGGDGRARGDRSDASRSVGAVIAGHEDLRAMMSAYPSA